MDEIINLHDQKTDVLESQIAKYALDLFAHTSSAAFGFDLDPPNRRIFILAGEYRDLKRMIERLK